MKIDQADTIFSIYIRTRDKWACQRCYTKYEPPTKALHCSHYWSRGKECMRFNPENCISLCYGCHRLWGHGDEREKYKLFMIKKLGQEKYDLLEWHAHNSFCKKNRKLEKLYWEQELKKLSNV